MFFSVRQTHRELNEALKRSASEESAITYPGHGQQAVASCAFSKTVATRKVTIYSARARC